MQIATSVNMPCKSARWLILLCETHLFRSILCLKMRYPLLLSPNKFVNDSSLPFVSLSLLLCHQKLWLEYRGFSPIECVKLKPYMWISIWLYIQLARVHLIATAESCFSTAYQVKNNSVLLFPARKHPAGFSHRRFVPMTPESIGLSTLFLVVVVVSLFIL